MRTFLIKSLLASLLGTSTTAASAPQSPSVPPAAQVQAVAPLTADEARRTALSLAAVLEQNYALPEVGTRYAAALRAKAQAGGYDKAGTAGDLARLLTADVQAVAPDNHLKVLPAGAGPRPMMVRRTPGVGSERPEGAPPPIEEARWLAPGIAYIRFTEFTGDPDTVAAAARFMAEHAAAGTVIIDIRTHRGGGLAEMDAMFPYLYGKETALLQMDTRASVDRAGGMPLQQFALRAVPGPEGVVRREHFVRPHPSESRLFDAKVILLTSNFTASAAEHLALALKRTGRATLIGEPTAGAGNFGGMRPIGDRFTAFVPVGMTRDPESGARWEGNGIEPDIAVPAERALVEALVRSGIPAAEAERLSAEVHPKRPMRRPGNRA